MKIYRQMYREAIPSADFDRLIESGEAKKKNWFMDYYLPEKRASEIFDEICKEHKITKHEKHRISMEIWFGAAPTSVKKDD